MTEISEDVSLLPYNTFGFDVRAKWFVEYDTVEDLAALPHFPSFKGQRLLPIGRGSNMLFTRDFDGVILHSRIGGIEIVDEADEVLVNVGSGVVWDDFCQWAIGHGLYGVENLSGIPGECGAAAVQNIGAYGVEVGSIIREVRTLDLTTCSPRAFRRLECRYGYRDSIFKSGPTAGRYVVTSVQIALSRQEKYTLDYIDLRNALKGRTDLSLPVIREAVLALRTAKLPDPARTGNAGSFFKNPILTRAAFDNVRNVYPFIPFHEIDAKRVKIPAAWLIEQCGWKGRNIGGAAVHDKQCLVIVNHGNATPDDVLRLKDSIIRTVKARFDIDLEPEVNIL